MAISTKVLAVLTKKGIWELGEMRVRLNFRTWSELLGGWHFRPNNRRATCLTKDGGESSI